MIPDLDPCQMITHPYKEGLKFVLINLGPTHVKFSFICHFDPKGLNRYSIVSFPEITNLNPENICFCLCYFLWSHSQGRDFIMLFDFLFIFLSWPSWVYQYVYLLNIKTGRNLWNQFSHRLMLQVISLYCCIVYLKGFHVSVIFHYNNEHGGWWDLIWIYIWADSVKIQMIIGPSVSLACQYFFKDVT